MKKILSISFLILTSLQLFAQNTSAAPKKKGVLPETLVNLEVQYERLLGGGISASVLGGGVKAMIGSKNTGLLLGFTKGFSPLSTFKYNSFKLGYQYGIVSGFYANANFNLAIIQPNNYSARVRSIRVNLGIGYTLSFGKKKRLYYNIETAFAAIRTNTTLPRFAIYSGIGFRLGTPAKTSYDGIKEVHTVPVKL